MLKQMIRRKLQQTLKQEKGKVFPLPPPITVPSCGVFWNPAPSSLFRPFPRSNPCLGNTACAVSLARRQLLRHPPHTQGSQAPLTGLAWFDQQQTEPAQGNKELGLESQCPPAGRALKRVLHTRPPSTGWTREECVGKQTPGWVNRELDEGETSPLLQSLHHPTWIESWLWSHSVPHGTI